MIGERGLCDTRISDIAGRAGTSSALILYYFQTKDRLLAEALAFSEDRFYEETTAELAEIEGAKGPPGPAHRAFLLRGHRRGALGGRMGPVARHVGALAP